MATMSLNTATLEHQPVDQIENHAFRPGWNTDMAQRLVMWATAFLLELADPLGVAESFAQDRAFHGYEHKIDEKELKPWCTAGATQKCDGQC